MTSNPSIGSDNASFGEHDLSDSRAESVAATEDSDNSHRVRAEGGGCGYICCSRRPWKFEGPSESEEEDMVCYHIFWLPVPETEIENEAYLRIVKDDLEFNLPLVIYEISRVWNIRLMRKMDYWDDRDRNVLEEIAEKQRQMKQRFDDKFGTVSDEIKEAQLDRVACQPDLMTMDADEIEDFLESILNGLAEQ